MIGRWIPGLVMTLLWFSPACGGAGADTHATAPNEAAPAAGARVANPPTVSDRPAPPENDTPESPADLELGQGWLGVSLYQLDLEEAQARGLEAETIEVRRVFPGTPADASELQVGDWILAMDGVPFAGADDMVARVGATPPGTLVTFTIERDGQHLEQPVMLGVRPELEELVASIFRGNSAPPVVVYDIRNDERLSLEARDGEIVILDFWATWCGPCRRALPSLNDLHRRYGEYGVSLIGVSDEEPAQIRTFLETHPIDYTVAYDVEHETSHAYFITAYPTLFLIDATGTVREVFIGGAEIPDLEARLVELLGISTPQ